MNMRKLIIGGVVGALVLGPIGSALAATDYYLKIEGVEGESTSAGTAAPVRAVRATTTPTEAKGNVEYGWKVEKGESIETTGIEPDDIDASNSDESEAKGNVEYGWKVEEGEKLETTGVEPDEIDFMGEGEPLTTNFGVLLGGGSDDGDEEGKEAALEIILKGAEEEGAPMEQISLNYEKIEAKLAQSVKLFGFIPVMVKADVEIDSENQVKVRFPWWAIFAAGDDGEALGEKVFTALSNVLKTKHNTIKNSIGNVR